MRVYFSSYTLFPSVYPCLDPVVRGAKVSGYDGEEGRVLSLFWMGTFLVYCISYFVTKQLTLPPTIVTVIVIVRKGMFG